MPPSSPTYRVFGWLFPRGLAAIYIIAYGSWMWQAEALTGEHGIMPVSNLLKNFAAYAEREGFTPWAQLPTLYWLGYTDEMARWLCLGGCAAAVLVMAGVLQGPLLAALWFGYLSICSTGDVFMGYQWDGLLLEAGLIAAVISPWRLFAGRIHEALPSPSGLQMLLPQILIFKLMFFSGLLKLTSGDEAWRKLSALKWHYETQPIPTWLGWYAHQMPSWMHELACVTMFVIEMALPVVVMLALLLERFLPAGFEIFRGIKVVTAAAFAGLMVVVELTGNYTFFNVLTILLALSVLDDTAWPGFVCRWLRWTDEAPSLPAWLGYPQRALVCVLLALSILAGAGEILPDKADIQGARAWVMKQVAPYRSVNGYGLFRVMTKERNEIVIEVSDDGAYFQPMEFRWKPGLASRPPPFVAPHQPRLDWQLWFASFNPGYAPQRDARNARMLWFGGFMEALLNHNPKVYALLEPPPFPMENIRAVRAKYYRYKFTDSKTRKETGDWWTVTALGDYSATFRKR